ncbi:MAG: aldo/keto reductase, partial [Candidatus Omnitrophica bacterium]|nr:aldo/keto reductase [Candidatus Omnitrophota bacterium]
SYEMTDGDWEVWRAMEKLQESGQTRMIGVSNVSLQHLTQLLKKAKIKPQIVQNRCYAIRGWDKPVREFCLQNQMIYEGFSLLTANQQVCFHPQVAAIAEKYGLTPEQVIFCFAVQIGILPLTGTTDPQHMKEDLETAKFELSDDDVKLIYELR